MGAYYASQTYPDTDWEDLNDEPINPEALQQAAKDFLPESLLSTTSNNNATATNSGEDADSAEISESATNDSSANTYTEDPDQ